MTARSYSLLENPEICSFCDGKAENTHTIHKKQNLGLRSCTDHRWEGMCGYKAYLKERKLVRLHDAYNNSKNILRYLMYEIFLLDKPFFDATAQKKPMLLQLAYADGDLLRFHLPMEDWTDYCLQKDAEGEWTLPVILEDGVGSAIRFNDILHGTLTPGTQYKWNIPQIIEYLESGFYEL